METMIETIKSKAVKTRKEHRCYSCRRKFQTGTTMNYWAGKNDGDFVELYYCMTCQAIMRYQEPNEDGGYPEFFVSNQLNPGQTPEDLLLELNENTHK